MLVHGEMLLTFSLLVASPPALRTTHRPPRFTLAQEKARKALLADSANKSEAARHTVLLMIDAIKPSLHAPYASYSSATLLAMLEWEYARLPIQHNAPLDDNDRGGDTTLCDDTTLLIQLTNGYIQNVCQRWVLGGGETHLSLHQRIMVPDFKLPPWKNESDPTMREANDCFLCARRLNPRTHFPAQAITCFVCQVQLERDRQAECRLLPIWLGDIRAQSSQHGAARDRAGRLWRLPRRHQVPRHT